MKRKDLARALAVGRARLAPFGAQLWHSLAALGFGRIE